jgi:hypothetical protein
MRWNAVAVGASSLRRTKMGAKAMHSAPVTIAINAH